MGQAGRAPLVAVHGSAAAPERAADEGPRAGTAPARALLRRAADPRLGQR